MQNQLNFPIFQFVRLAFHDCLKYSDDLNGNEVNGCDGCLHPMGMNVDLMEKYEDSRNAPNNLTFFTNNNGLTATADILEEVFTNPNFPRSKDLPSLDVSMKNSGKSRADLWAFAALVGLYKGIENNNKACDGQANAAVCGHREAFQVGCEVDFPRIPRFQTGRKDCIGMVQL